MSTSPLLSPASRAILRDFLLGGSLVGVAGGSAAALYQHLRKLQQKADAATDTSGDDNSLYVNVPDPARKQANFMDTWAPGLALVGGPLAAIGTAEMVRRLYNRFRKQQLQKELDASQQLYLDSLRRPGQGGEMKQASTLVGAAEALPLFLLLTSGLLSYETMKKQFPEVKPAQGSQAPRLVVRRLPASPSPAELPSPQDEPMREGEGMVKLQSADADEHLFRQVLELPQADYLRALVDAACVPTGPETILKAASEGRLFHFEKGEKANAMTRNCAISWLIRDAELAPAIKLACAAEIFETAPVLVALGHVAADLGLADDMRKLAALHTAALRPDWSGIKAASVMAAQPQAPVDTMQDPALVADVLRQALSSGKLSQGDPQETVMSLDSEESSNRTQTGSAPVESEADKDIIDEVLAPKSLGGAASPAKPALSAPVV